MKTLLNSSSIIAVSCILSISSAAIASDSVFPADTDSKVTRKLISPQVSIKAKFSEASKKGSLKINASLITDVTCLGFINGVLCITNVVTITNTCQSLNLDGFEKINKKNNSVKYAKITTGMKHLARLKLKNGMLSLRIRNKYYGQNVLPVLMGIPFMPTVMTQEKQICILLSILNQIQLMQIISINYSVSDTGLMKIKTVK